MLTMRRQAAGPCTGLVLAMLSVIPQTTRVEAENSKAITVYARDIAFCKRLVRELDQVKVIEPILTSPKLWRFVDTRDDRKPQGEWYVEANRYYFIDKRLRNPEPDLNRILRRPGWRQRLFRPGSPMPPTKAQARLGMKLIYDPTGRWRALERRFPGFLLTKVKDFFGRVTQAPKWFALYLVDFNGDGKKEHILHRQYAGPGGMKTWSGDQLIDRIDLKTGKTRRIAEKMEMYFADSPVRIVRYRGRVYLVSDSTFAIWFGGTVSKTAPPQINAGLCEFVNVKSLQDVQRRKLIFKSHRN